MEDKHIKQHIYLYMDDSGKLSRSEEYSVFAGIVFNTNNEKSEFVNKYKTVLSDIKCNYCSYYINDICDNNCPEIKGSIISPSDRRRIMNLGKKFCTFATIIYNKNVAPHVFTDKASKGRFNEYSQRRVVKETVNYLIKEKKIDPFLPVHLHVNIDEMPTKSNGYYSLRNGLIEELKYGILNYNYGKKFKPILFGDLEVQVIYRDSKHDYCIQMADIIANTVRHSIVINNNWFDTKEYLTNKLCINVLLRLPN